MIKIEFKLPIILFLAIFFLCLFNLSPLRLNLTISSQENFKIDLSKTILFQGDALIIGLKLPPEVKLINLFFEDKKLNFYEFEKNYWLSFYGISVKHKPGVYSIKVDLSNNQQIKRKVIIKKKNFSITKVQTTKELEEKDFTLEKISQKINQENELLKDIYSQKSEQVYFSKEFSYPLQDIKVVGDFGNIRKSQNNQFQHLGVDLEAKINTPVYSINDGIVKLAKELKTYGKTVIIDHGLSIKSIYLHLNEILVKENQIVKNKEIIGLTGNSGYSIEPHLHLSIKINENSVDPLKFIKDSKVFLKKIDSAKISQISNKKFLATINKSINWGFKENKNKRNIDTIIIHSSYNPLDNDPHNVEKIIDIYKNYGVASHYLIDKEGKIYKLVDENNIAYHAGESKMPDGRTKVNNFSIGIEIIYKKDEEPNEIQYQKLVELIKDIKSRHNIKYILGHNQIAPLRKDDPWNFNWQKLENLLND